MKNCCCGHMEDEHGPTDEAPKGTPCHVEGCECPMFDWDGEEPED